MKTLNYLKTIDHALEGLPAKDDLQRAEINNIRVSIQAAITGFEENMDDAEDFAIQMIELLRDRIDRIATSDWWAGEHEKYRKTQPAPPPEGCEITK